MDTAGVETVDFNALGGADLVTVNDLSGTDVSNVNLDLAGTLGGATGDGAADRVVVNGTNGDNTIHVNGDAGAVNVRGLAAAVNVLHPEGARTGSRSTPSRARTLWTPAAWRPVRSSSS